MTIQTCLLLLLSTEICLSVVDRGIASKASKGLMMSEAMRREMKIVFQYIIDKVYIASSL